MQSYILGRNPVLEALRAGRPLNKLWVAQGATEGSIREIRAVARAAGVLMDEVDRARLDAMTGGANHQGVVAVAAAMEYADLDDIVSQAAASGRDPFLVVLDGLEDPQNLGSILRTCDAAGVHGVVIPERRAVGLTPTVAKVAAGAMEHVPVARVVNIARALEQLKERGYWICGAHQKAKQVYHQARLTGPVALVVGGEGKGLGRLVAEHCDFLVSIPMLGHVGSLNAAVAAAVLIYEVVRQRQA